MKPVNRSTPNNQGSAGKDSGRSSPATSGSGCPLAAGARPISATLYQPIIVGLLTSRTVDSLAIRGREVLLLLLVRVLVTAFGVAAGLALRRRHARAVGLAKVSLLLSGATELFIVLTPSFSKQPRARRDANLGCWNPDLLRRMVRVSHALG